MVKVVLLTSLGTLLAGVWLYSEVFVEPALPIVPEQGYFGRGEPRPDDTRIYDFRINESQAELDELKARLRSARVRHESPEGVLDNAYGMPLYMLQHFADYWLHKYDWRATERQLNQLHHFRTQIEGLHIHFVHEKPVEGKYRRVVPLLISHGWPGTVHEFHKAIPMLVDPRANGFPNQDWAFEVVAPSIPGFGWMFLKLMQRLRLGRFLAQGGDWGYGVVSSIARLHPDSLLGLHLNMLYPTKRSLLATGLAGVVAPDWVYGSAEPHKQFNLLSAWWFYIQKAAYFHIQALTPDTAGIALNDSPLGLLAWTLEKYVMAVDMRILEMPNMQEHLLKKLSYEDVLTPVTIYSNMLTAMRIYKENMESPAFRRLEQIYIKVPTAYSPGEHDPVLPLPRTLADRVANVTYSTFMKDIGHFIALEAPLKYSQDLFTFSNQLL